MRALILLAATVAVLASACGGSSDPLAPVADRDGPFGTWELTAASPPIEVVDGARITLVVEQAADGAVRAGGTAACNSYGATVVLDGAGWSLQEVGATEMGCTPATLMDAERAYLDALVAVDAWGRDADELSLTGPGTRLTFQRLADVEPASLTGTAWVLDGFVSGSGPDGSVGSTTAGTPAAELRLDEDGGFTLFTGCRDFAGEWSTAGDEVVLPSWGEVDGSRGVGADGEPTCGPAAEEQERQVLGVLEDSFVPEVASGRLTVLRGEVGLVFRDGAEDG